MMDCDELQTPLLDAQMALSKLHLCGLVWEVRTDFGTVCAGRTAILTQSDRKRQGLGHPRVDPPRWCWWWTWSWPLDGKISLHV